MRGRSGLVLLTAAAAVGLAWVWPRGDSAGAGHLVPEPATTAATASTATTRPGPTAVVLPDTKTVVGLGLDPALAAPAGGGRDAVPRLHGHPHGRVVDGRTGQGVEALPLTLRRGDTRVTVWSDSTGRFAVPPESTPWSPGPVFYSALDRTGERHIADGSHEFDPADTTGFVVRVRVGPCFTLLPHWPVSTTFDGPLAREETVLEVELQAVTVDWRSAAREESEQTRRPRPGTTVGRGERWRTRAGYRDGVWRAHFDDLFDWARHADELPVGEWRLVVSDASRGLTGAVLVDRAYGPSGAWPVTLGAASSLAVRVVDEEGAELGAELQLARAAAPPHSWSSTPSGHATWDGLDSGTYEVHATSPGREPGTLRVTLAGGEERRLVLALRPSPHASPLAGRLFLASGSPPGSAHVLLDLEHDGRPYSRSVRVDWDGRVGRFRFPSVPSGEVRLSLAGTGSLTFEPRVATLTHPGPAPEFRCDNGSLTALVLDVVDEHGVSVPDVRAEVLCSVGHGQRSYTCSPNPGEPVAVVAEGTSVNLRVRAPDHGTAALGLEEFGPVERYGGTFRRTARVELRRRGTPPRAPAQLRSRVPRPVPRAERAPFGDR